jgi:hypothetical protein
MSYLRRSKNRRSEDVVGLAGWLFTDLLLGLALIFLATASFQVFGDKDGDPCTTDYEKNYYATPLLKEYKNASDAFQNIAKDIKFFATDSKLKEPEVAVGLYWGNYSASETAQQGQIRAWNFYNEGLRPADSANFTELPGYKSEVSKNMRFLGESSSRRSINSVRIELYFIYDQCKVVSPSTT